MKKLFIVLAVFSCNAFSAPTQNIKCKAELSYEYYPEFIPELTKSCADYGSELEQCTSFSIHAIGNPKKYAYSDAQSGIKKTDGFLDFKPVALSSFEEKTKEGAARRWLLSFIDNSGSASSAEEKFIVIDGAFKPVTPMLSYADKERFLKKTKFATNVMEETMKCSVSKAKR